MDKIWDRESFEVGGHWLLLRDEKTERPRRTDKSRTLKKTKKTISRLITIFFVHNFFEIHLSTI